MDAVVEALTHLSGLPGVSDAVDAARQACTDLRWHPALRRRTEEARTESGVRAARCSAYLDGARLPVNAVRDAARGAVALPDDAVGATVRGALRAVAEARHLEKTLVTAPAQALARLHTAAAAGLVPDEATGRPRRDGESPGDGVDGLGPAPQGRDLAARLEGIGDLLRAPSSAPALLVASLVHAEVATARPFVAGNGVVARALARAVVVGRGLDPFGVAVWEAALVDSSAEYGLALLDYSSGSADAVAGWLRMQAAALVAGAAEGQAVCAAVLAGRLTR